jgi:glutamyl-tRNA reductase
LNCILVANRTFERAQRLAESLGGQAVHFDALTEKLPLADIVICSTSAPHIVLHAPEVQAALLQKAAHLKVAAGTSRMLIADLAVPCNADPAIAALPGAVLVKIDDLALDLHRHPLSDCRIETVLAQELAYFRGWCSARRSAALIRLLHERAEAICEAEVQRTLRRMGPLTDEQQQQIRMMAQALVNKLLHQPVNWLRRIPCDEDPQPYLNLIEDLYQIS